MAECVDEGVCSKFSIQTVTLGSERFFQRRGWSTRGEKYNFLRTNICITPCCQFRAGYTLHPVLQSVARDFMQVPTDASLQPMQSHAWFPLSVTRTQQKHRVPEPTHCLWGLQRPGTPALQKVKLQKAPTLDITKPSQSLQTNYKWHRFFFFLK